jgi:sec-independent protein translocase protein TatA
MSLTVLLGAVGVWEAVLIVVALLVLFGGKKIPELMKGLGQGVKEFKKAKDEGFEESNQTSADQKSIK